jgi:hypothetical protein
LLWDLYGRISKVKGEVVMKKVVRSNNAGVSNAIQAPSASVNTVTTKLESKPQTASPTPVWTRYVDSRLKQFCMR